MNKRIVHIKKLMLKLEVIIDDIDEMESDLMFVTYDKEEKKELVKVKKKANRILSKLSDRLEKIQ